jgi:hypothetical protein
MHRAAGGEGGDGSEEQGGGGGGAAAGAVGAGLATPKEWCLQQWLAVEVCCRKACRSVAWSRDGGCVLHPNASTLPIHCSGSLSLMLVSAKRSARHCCCGGWAVLQL